MLTNDKRIRIIVGHYGSGKTEFAVNYAIKLSKEIDEINKKTQSDSADVLEKNTLRRVAIADIDVVNPYFRSREKEDMLKEYGIESFSSILKNSSLDLPSIAADIVRPMYDERYEYIIDVGGDEIGAKVLGRMSDDIKKYEYDMFMVVNKNREYTDEPHKVIQYIRDIESKSNLKVTGLVSNTHFLRDTQEVDIEEGISLVSEIEKQTNIPIRYITYWDKKEEFRKTISLNLKYSEYGAKLEKMDIENMIMPISMIMREDWM
ncbi:MAG: ATP-binding protein [Proteocatella sp.]